MKRCDCCGESYEENFVVHMEDDNAVLDACLYCMEYASGAVCHLVVPRKRRKGIEMLTELGKYLRTYRIQNGVTADEMADAAGVKKGALLKAETGSGRLTVKNLEGLYKLLVERTVSYVNYYQLLDKLYLGDSGVWDERKVLRGIVENELDGIEDGVVRGAIDMLRSGRVKEPAFLQAETERMERE